MLNRARLWIRSVVLRRRLEREMQEEMAEHLDRSTARLMGRGLSEEEARLQARREFGNVTYLKEEARYARGTGWLDALTADVRFALRQFARKPVTSLTMLVVLAVGMSISTLLFSYVHSYAVQPPLQVPLEDDLVRIRGSADAGIYGRSPRTFSEEEFRAYRTLTDHFAEVAGWSDAEVPLDAGDDVERRGLAARVTFVTENYFAVLGVRPILGAGLSAIESDGAAAAVINHDTWQRLFGRSPDVIGSTVSVNGVPITVVGVAPERFVGIGGYTPFHLWMPLSTRGLLLEAAPGFRAAARLRPGVGRQAATAAVQVVAARAAAAEEESGAAPAGESGPVDPSAEVVPLLAANGDPNFQRDVRAMALSVGLLALLVLLVTCTNVSALLTGLAAARRQEITIRLSLGAARMRLLRQLLTESALLATVAAAAALGIAWLIASAVGRFVPALPLDIGITWTATLFTFGVALAVGVLFGLSPALHANRLALASAARDSTATIVATRARLQRGLVVAQVAFTQPLIVLLAAVLLMYIGNSRPQTATQDADRLLLLNLRPSSALGATPTAGDSNQRLRLTMGRLGERLEATPGVVSTAIEWGSVRALGAYGVHAEDRSGDVPPRTVRLSGERAAEGYFRMRGISLLRGRAFEHADVGVLAPGGAEVPIIVGADLARRLWGGADPVGRRLRPATDTAAVAATLVVVGVIDDPASDLRDAADPYRVYLPPDTAQPPRILLVRTAEAAAPLIPVVRTIAQDEAPGMIATVRTLEEVETERARTFRLVTAGISAAGVLALLLSALGLYAVIAFSVAQRTGEIAVRMAVGARSAEIERKFVKDGLRLGLLGLGIGLPVSVLGLRALDAAMGNVSVSLPPVAAIAALGVLVVATAAAWIPARRAAAVDPAVALRRE